MKSLIEFKNYLIEEEKSPLTIEKYCRDVKLFLQWLAERPLSKQAVLSFKNELTERHVATSVNSMLSSLFCYLSFIGRGDCRVKSIRIQRSAFCAEEKELNRQEAERLMQAAQHKPWLQLLMQTIAATGIRVSEHRYITVEAAKGGKAMVRCKGKIRTILLPKKLCRVLLAYARRKRIGSGSIFVSRHGRPIDRSRIWAEMKKLCSAAGVLAEKVFPHNLRHLFARTFYSMEKDVVRLADILGHSSIDTTRIYTMESGQVHRRQIEKMPLIYIT